MDLDKLPKLSQTPPPPVQPQEQRTLEYAHIVLPPSRGEGWISIVIALVLLMLFPRFFQWLAHAAFGTAFNPFIDPAGNIVPYPQTIEFWMDLGPALFGVALLIEAGAIFSRNILVLWVSLVIVAMTTAYNALYFVLTLPTHGVALISFLAAATGIYMCIAQWKLLAALRLAGPHR